ncbi:hypothetical protein MRB53_034862 [Persea americana]|uniref:Uncharacterized protein n=1 Tax=Persea americana TaxID=3435 RepID=A0ACC2K326_PERAE|nr:hypothetical protein MRB53_034862 [Persea americana]
MNSASSHILRIPSQLLQNPNPNPSRSFLRAPKCAQNPNPICAAIAETTSSSSATAPELPRKKICRLVAEFRSLPKPVERVKRLLHYAGILPPLADSDRVPESRVTGCTAQVWLVVSMDGEGRMRFAADSDSEIAKGFCSCLIGVLDGAEPEEVLRLRMEELEARGRRRSSRRETRGKKRDAEAQLSNIGWIRRLENK